MKIVVAGASGQVATCLAMRARERQLDLSCLGRPDFDLLRPAEARKMVSGVTPDIIVNAAAFTDVERAEEDADKAFAVNAEGAGVLAIAAAQLSVPLIHISTDYVFSGEKLGPYCENDETAPINSYGRSKLAGERAVLANHHDSIVLRTSWVYSQFGKNFLTTIMKLLRIRDELNVVDDQIGCPTSAWDIADAILAVCEAKAKGNQNTGVYHVAGTGVTSWHGFATAIRDNVLRSGERSASIKAIDSASYPSKVRRPSNSVLSATKIQREFGITLPSWQKSLALCQQDLLDGGGP